MLRAVALVIMILPSLASALTIASYNVRNFDYDERYRISTDKPALEKILKDLKADLIAVNEINNQTEFSRFIKNRFSPMDFQLTRCGGENAQYLGFVWNPYKLKLLSFTEDLSVTNPGRSQMCEGGSRPLAIATFEIIESGKTFTAMAAHLKAGSNSNDLKKRQQQLEIITELIDDLKRTPNREFVLMGDFNTTTYLDKGPDYSAFTQMVRTLNARDLSAALGCTAYWWGGTDDGIETPSLLDHMVVSTGLIKKRDARAQVHSHCAKVACQEASLADLGISYEKVSDHCPQSATIQ